ncbi:MAG: hypothetical protein ABI873_05960 [Marmoricola sp.]
MTMGPAEIERKFRQHDNEIVEIYSMLGSIQGTLELHTIRFDEHDRRFDLLEGRFDLLEGRFDLLEGRFDEHDRRFDLLDGRFDLLEGRFDLLEGRFDQIDTKVDAIVEMLGGRTRLAEPPRLHIARSCLP